MNVLGSCSSPKLGLGKAEVWGVSREQACSCQLRHSVCTCSIPAHLTLKIHSRSSMARGERSEDVWAWYTAVYEAIQEIPYGRVTSYGHIARLVGKRTHASLPSQNSGLDSLT